MTVSEAKLPQSGVADYVQHLQSLRSLATACSARATACDASRVPPDERVVRGAGSWFESHYGWVREALTGGKSMSDGTRATLMQSVQVHLDADLADAQSEPPSPDFAGARQRADVILAGREFATVQEVSLKEELLARLYEWLERILGHVAGFGSRSPWIAPLIEWLLGSLACALLLVWALRTLRRQRVQMRFETSRRIDQTDERVLNWMRESEAHAAAGRYRDAVHCLYWASIATLEGRRLWNPDRARTPREYTRLLDPASPASPLLHRQTLCFEIIWYGLRPAEQPDYDSALDLHRQLRAA
ncbi:MAG: DUF4129 domain-containing protein [Acidobacteriaceae bacterium]